MSPATPTRCAKFSFTVCLCRMRTICLKSRRRFATLSVDGKRADVLDLLWLVRCWKLEYRLYYRQYSFYLWFIVSLPFVRGKGRGKKVCSSFVVARSFFSTKITSDSRFGANRTLRITWKKGQRYWRCWWIRGTSKYVKCVRMWSKIYVAKYLVIPSLEIRSEFPHVFDNLVVVEVNIDNFFADFFKLKS